MTSDPVRADSEERGRSESEELHGVFQRRMNLFNLLVSIINALTLPVVGMIASVCVLFVWKRSVTLSAAHLREPTVDNKLPVLLLRVLHGVKCLLGDAVQVHIPPVLQHLKGDVGAVYHSPRRLRTDTSAILPTRAYPYPLSAVFVHMDFY